jgi:hypothetical protein
MISIYYQIAIIDCIFMYSSILFQVTEWLTIQDGSGMSGGDYEHFDKKAIITESVIEKLATNDQKASVEN